MAKSSPPIVGFIVFAIIAFWMFNRANIQCSEAPSGPVGHPAASSTEQPPESSHEQLLEVPVGIERQDGIAAAILIDTSGSMRDKVPDATGQESPKIQIAQQCVLDLVGRCEEFSKAHPDKKVQLGIYEFSVRSGHPLCRQVVTMGRPSLATAEPAVKKMRPSGGTPIGEAMITAKKDLDATGLRQMHMLVVTDGMSNHGHAPEAVADAIARLPEEHRASVYFVAFDVAADRFSKVRDAGGLVLAAGSGDELHQALDYLLTGKILAEQPEAPSARP